MLDVMLCMPKSAWGLVLEKVEKKIGAAARAKRKTENAATP